MKDMKHFVAVVGCVGLSATVLAGVVSVDGTAEALYGPAVSVQNVQTQFGDSSLGTVDYANGSELDAGYAFIADGYLNIVASGNLESNFNKLEIFIDCKSGGQNRLRGDNLDVDFNGLNRMGDDGSGNGLTFDKGFEADFWVGVTCGGDPFTLYVNCAELLTDGGSGAGGYQGSTGALVPLVSGNGLEVAIDNSNALGVIGGTEAGDGSGVVTGVEYRIPLALLGYTSGPIRVGAFVNGGGHDYVSNQTLGGSGPGAGNLGDPRFVNFNLVAGEQFFVVPGTDIAPCPADFNEDGVVDGADLGSLLGAWNQFGAIQDLNGDGLVDGADLGSLLGDWGACE
jgi:hypothetical protein